MPSNIRDLKGPVKICHSGTLKKRLSYSESCCTAAVCMMQNVRRGTHATVHAPNFLALWRRPIGPIIAATPGCFKVIVWINLFWVSIALIRCADPQRQNAYWNSTVSGIKRIISTVDGWISINVLSLWVCTSDECKKDWFTRWPWNTLWHKNHYNYQTILCTIRTAWNTQNSRQCNKL